MINGLKIKILFSSSLITSPKDDSPFNPSEEFKVGKGRILREGTDCAIIVTGGILEEAQKKNKYYRLIETRIAYLIRNKIIERNNKGTYKLHLDSLTTDDWALIHGLSLLPPSKAYRLPSIGDLISR